MSELDSDTPVRIEPIRIIMNLNLPGKLNEPIIFSSSMIHYLNKSATPNTTPISLSEYPFFTPDIRYPKEVLNRYTYEKIIDFFFNRESFESVLGGASKSYTVKSENIDTDDIPYSSDAYNAMNIGNSNVELMIDLLFPTIFPVINNNISSFAQYIMKRDKKLFTFKGSIPSVFTGIISQIAPSFSYLNMSGNTYTITKTTWLNDFANNPIYKNFLNSYITFELWRTSTNNALKREKKSIVTNVVKIVEPPAYETIDRNEKILDRISNTKKVNPSARTYVIQNGNISEQIDGLKQEIRKLFGYDTEGDKPFGFRSKLNQVNNDSSKNDSDDDDDVKVEEQTQSDIISDMNSNIGDIINSVNEINSYISIISSSISGFKLSGSLLVKMTKITNFINNYNVVDNLSQNYFGSNEININFDDDDTIPVDMKRGKYSKYSNFIASVRSLMNPVRETSNTQLQDIINDYANNVSPYFNTYLKYVRERYFLNNPKIPFTKSPEYFKTVTAEHPNMPIFVGISRIDEPTPIYEIYMQVDVIGGEVTNETKHLLGCDYMGDLLGHKLQTIINKSKKKGSISIDENISYRVEVNKFYYDLQPNIDKYMNMSSSESSRFESLKNRVFGSPKLDSMTSNKRGGSHRKRITMKKKNGRFKFTRKRR